MSPVKYILRIILTIRNHVHAIAHVIEGASNTIEDGTIGKYTTVLNGGTIDRFLSVEMVVIMRNTKNVLKDNTRGEDLEDRLFTRTELMLVVAVLIEERN
jgi:hypothetical protein